MDTERPGKWAGIGRDQFPHVCEPPPEERASETGTGSHGRHTAWHLGPVVEVAGRPVSRLVTVGFGRLAVPKPNPPKLTSTDGLPSHTIDKDVTPHPRGTWPCGHPEQPLDGAR